MSQKDHQAFVAEAIGAMAAAYQNAQVSATTIMIYVRLLEDIPLEYLTVAIEQSMADSKFMPTVAEIREKALGLMEPERPTPLEAWGIVKEQMSSTGFYRSPKFDDPNIARAVECLGWKTLCSSENEPADRAHFARVYESLVQREAADRRLLPAARQLRELLEQASDQKQLIDGRRR